MSSIDYADELNSLCAKYDCPLGVGRIDWLGAQLSELQTVERDLAEISKSIGSVRWMDPPDGGSVSLGEQVRRMRCDLETLEEALMPSSDTKAAYAGEFYMGVTLSANGEEDYRRVQIPWMTIKEIMSAIRERALSNSERTDG